MSNKELFSALLKASEQHPGHWHEVGGNAPVMAARFAAEGATVLLAAPSSVYLAAWLPHNVTSQLRKGFTIILLVEIWKA